MKRILTVIGARPQFIKAAPVSRALVNVGLREEIVHTGQHFDIGMSNVFFDELGIPEPKYHLGVSGGGHGAMTGAMLQALEPLIEHVKPDWVLVYGDTNSTLAGALAASKLNIPLAHVEAGLRSFNRRMPEEQNRIVTDHLADLLLTPTDGATRRLREEGIPDARVVQVGDVMFDAALYYAGRAAECSTVLKQYGLPAGAYVLATVHRADNTDIPGRLRAIVDGLEAVAAEQPVILPLHPRTRAALERDGITFTRVHAIDPVGYLDMVMLERHAALIATDSGGVQKEAYFHGVPCVTLRDETEWTELVDLGWNRLAPPGRADIAAEIRAALGSIGRDGRPYGDGDAAEHIARVISGAPVATVE